MAEILPLKGLLYNKEKIDDISKVIAPPYDVIPSNLKKELHEASDYNVIRLILGKDQGVDALKDNKTDDGEKYKKAATCLNKWIDEGVLKVDEKPAIYLYDQEYIYKEKKYTRKGFIALTRIEDYDKGVINPHEHTLSKPKADRLNLLRECQTNLSQIFCIYSDEDMKLENFIENDSTKEVFVSLTDDKGIKHTITRVTDEYTINKLSTFMSDKKLYIADGHHRYETTLNYRNECRENGNNKTLNSEYVMAYFTNMEANGSNIFPTHRLLFDLENFNKDTLLNRISECFDIETVDLGNGTEKKEKIEQGIAKMQEKGESAITFGAYFGDNKLNIMSLKDKNFALTHIEDTKSDDLKLLDVNVLHKIIFNKMVGLDSKSIANQQNLAYEVNEGFAIEKVDQGQFQAAFLLNATKIEALRNIVNAGEKMPQKSTYFYPKLKSGFIMNKL